ncbi:MAG: nicotinate (nicotinamide) nucleotide adenylyltransferase [Desulfobulbaceae bacterium]|nr:MAG: nicotinate (nicotinamide) nucleotide adenylyltransferase [Desulfobulbaceae bacterium]
MVAIGILGGTFDPLHFGHLQIAEAAVKEYALDKIIFVPSAIPPHKDSAAIAKFDHRFTMVELGIENLTSYEVSDIESGTDSPSYTYHTLQKLTLMTGGEAELYFIIGCDAFLEIQGWFQWEQILLSTNFIITKRAGIASEPVEALLRANKYQRHSTKPFEIWHKGDGTATVNFLNQIPQPISSSAIRSAIRQGGRWQHTVPRSVVDYIEKHQIYHPSSDS